MVQTEPAHESTVLPEQHRDGIVLQVLRPDLADRVCDVMATAFTSEPVVASALGESALGARHKEWAAFCRLFSKECATNGLSVVAVDSRAKYRVAGAFWVRDFKQALPEGFDAAVWGRHSACPTVAKLVDVMNELDEKYETKRSEAGEAAFEADDAADLFLLGVGPEYVRRGLDKILIKAALRHVHACGYRYAVLRTTGGIASAHAQRAGMKVAAELEYGEAQQDAFATLSGTVNDRMVVHEHFKDVPSRKKPSRWAWLTSRRTLVIGTCVVAGLAIAGIAYSRARK